MQNTENRHFWHKAASVGQMEARDRLVVKIDDRQIAIFKTADGLYAINNRCPHEGYPLIEGSLQGDCKLACNWHGWAFDLKNGKAIQGKDPVKTYPVKTQDGFVMVEIVPLDNTLLREAALLEFDEAFREHDYERIARSLCRYEFADGALEDIAIHVLKASLFTHERGFGHAHAGLADWISLAGDDSELRLVAFLEALGHFSWDSLFSTKPEPVPSSEVWNQTDFLLAIEAMDQPSALRQCKGAFEAGLTFTDLKCLFLEQNFRHYAGFGHPAIYLAKAEQLLGYLGDDIEETVCLLLTRYWCIAAREDLIPEFKEFGSILAGPQNTGGMILPQPETLSEIPQRKLMPLVDAAADENKDKWETLLAASAISMLRFDTDRQDIVDQPIAQNVGWLAFTHAITFAESLYFHADSNPSLWRSGLLQQACFIGRNSRFLADNQIANCPVINAEDFLTEQKAALFDMDAGDYIYSVHRLKMVSAIEKLVALVSRDTAKLLVAALSRYLNSPLRQKHPARTMAQARAAVARE